MRIARGLRWIAAAVLAAAVVIGLVGPPRASAVPAGNRIAWNGGSWYLHGANVPWFNWSCDFGCGAGGGVSAPSVHDGLAPVFAQAASVGLHTIRWWAFEGGAWQITRDAAGAPLEVNPAVYADFDAALALAAQYDLYYDFVLFSGADSGSIPSAWLTDPAQRQMLANALGVLFAHYAGNSHILSWESFNEPDFSVWNGLIDQASLSATVQAIGAAVHANSTAYYTVGLGFADGLPMVTGRGLDYYQAHWYDYMSGGTYCLRCNNYAFYQSMFNLDAPLVIGETYMGANVDALQRMQDFYAKGYAGAWPWSLFPTHTYDLMAIDLAAAATFAAAIPDEGPRASGGGPTPTATTSPPVATATATSTAVLPTATAVAATATSVTTAVTSTAVVTSTSTATTTAATATPPPAATATAAASVTVAPTRTPPGRGLGRGRGHPNR